MSNLIDDQDDGLGESARSSLFMTDTTQATVAVLDRPTVSSPDPIEGVRSDGLSGDMEDGTLDSLRGMSIDDVPLNRSSNPSSLFSGNTQQPSSGLGRSTSYNSDDLSIGRRIRPDLQGSERGSADESSKCITLPEDDGMRVLRAELHRVREMALSSEEKAKRMHALMMADYTSLTGLKDSNNSRDLTKPNPIHPFSGTDILPGKGDDDTDRNFIYSTSNMDNPFKLRPGDTKPSYRPINFSSSNDIPALKDLPKGVDSPTRVLGCEHYMRNVKVQCIDCERWYTCRHCHDAVESHILNRKKIRHMLCMFCGRPQPAASHCRQCGQETAAYYCDICKLWDNDPSRNIYHCDDCGICRRGQGLGKDYIHCKKCNVCISINWASNHRCVERATECDCPICGDFMFSSSAAVVAMKCGHYIHRTCYDAYMQTSYKCPICNRSAVNMETQWRKLDYCVESQPMPEQYRDTKMHIVCNDCAARSCVPYHWIGNKCAVCGSYNTNDVRMANEHIEENQRQQVAPEDAQIRASSSLVGQGPIFGSGTPGNGRERSPLPEPIAMSAEPSADGHTYQQNPRSPLQDLHQSIYNSAAPFDSTVLAANNTAETVSENEETIMTDVEDPTATPAEEDEDVDDAAFWGEGISRPNWNLPAGGWTSPRLLARATSSGEDTVDSTSPNSTSWSIDPRHWRLGSPRLFARSDEQVDVHASSPPRGRTTDRNETAWMPSASASAWTIDPRQWRLSSPSFFTSRSADAPDQLEDSEDHEYDQQTGGVRIVGDENRSPVRDWINSRFIAAGFGGGENENAIESSEGSGEDGDSVEESDSELDDEGVEGDAEGDGEEALDEMELQLPGHR